MTGVARPYGCPVHEPALARVAPLKQHRTAKLVFERPRDEHGFAGGYTVLKDHVRIGGARAVRAVAASTRACPGSFGGAITMIRGSVCQKMHFEVAAMLSGADCSPYFSLRTFSFVPALVAMNGRNRCCGRKVVRLSPVLSWTFRLSLIN